MKRKHVIHFVFIVPMPWGDGIVDVVSLSLVGSTVEEGIEKTILRTVILS